MTMANYQSPGVYVEEVPSAVQPIAGVGTSTAGFIGVIAGPEITIPRPNPDYNPSKGENDIIEVEPTVEHLLGKTLAEKLNVSIPKNKLAKGTMLTLNLAKALKKKGGSIKVEYILSGADLTADNLMGNTVLKEIETDGKVIIKRGEVVTKKVVESHLKALKKADIQEINVEGDISLEDKNAKDLVGKKLAQDVPLETSAGKELSAGTLIKDKEVAVSVIEAKGSTKIKVKNLPCQIETFSFEKNDAAKPGEVKLCANFGQFKKYFGDFSTDPEQSNLAHAVYGFFNNGGTRCYVVRENSEAEITSSALKKFEAIDEIAIVAAPGRTEDSVRSGIVTHCKTFTQNRFAIFDGPKIVDGDDPAKFEEQNLPTNSDYAAYYVPWIQVFDPATKVMNPQGDGLIYVSPSGHIAGIYARVDTNRGVHKAPANETVLGALGLKYQISKAHQIGLNPKGVNCIRNLNGNITVWGARTIGGDRNMEWKYINVRRLFLYLRKSIDQGTQWVVFEPNTPELWAKITRNITAFLTNVWRDGALFGNTPQEAFYVKCDAEINPPEVRDLGQVVTEIGVAVVKPAEFVIFRISQWAGPGE
jgi:phage tail sheath protein FI